VIEAAARRISLMLTAGAVVGDWRWKNVREKNRLFLEEEKRRFE
jgi:hypothetical protein